LHAADQVMKAIGQGFVADLLCGESVALNGGRFAVDAEMRTSLPDVWAGGDYVFGGEDLTIQAVDHGRHRALHPRRPCRLNPGSSDTADLRTDFLGTKSPTAFWLASAPSTDKKYNVERAFRAGWGGVVWKALGKDPAMVNVNGPRYGAIHADDRRLAGLNDIERITDRPLELNLREIAEEMICGLAQYMDGRGFATVDDFRGRAVRNLSDWRYPTSTTSPGQR
jgi:hypothetical protein